MPKHKSNLNFRNQKETFRGVGFLLERNLPHVPTSLQLADVPIIVGTFDPYHDIKTPPGHTFFYIYGFIFYIYVVFHVCIIIVKHIYI